MCVNDTAKIDYGGQAAREKGLLPSITALSPSTSVPITTNPLMIHSFLKAANTPKVRHATKRIRHTMLQDAKRYGDAGNRTLDRSQLA